MDERQRLLGRRPDETLKGYSTTLTLMGCVGFVVTLIGSVVLPLV